MFLRNTPELSCHGIFEKISGDTIYEIIHAKFHSFLEIENVENISVNSVNPAIIFDNFFAEKPPFQRKGKKSEFPDAFVLEAVNQASLKMSELIYIVSADQDMKDLCDGLDNLVYLEKVDDLIDLAIRNAEKLKKPANYADQIYSHLESAIMGEIKSQLDTMDFEHDDLDVWNDEELTGVTIDNVIFKNKNLLDVSEHHADYELEVDVELTASYSISDYDRSPWDPEDKAYVFVFTNDVIKKHTETYNFNVALEYLDGIKKNAEIVEVYFEYAAFTLSDFRSKIISVHENYFED